MIDFLIYALALFLAPFLNGLLSFVLIIIFAPVIGLLKRKNNEKLLNIVFSIESFCSTFLTIILLDKVLNIFSLGINWLFVILFIVIMLINGMQRIKNTTNRDKLFEIYETVGDALGILSGFIVLLLL
jgi:membrane-associated HD superfamily phosphohydrolase